MNLVITQAAEQDLEHIADYIGADSPERASTFVQELVGVAGQLAIFPDGYPFVSRLEHKAMRRRPYGNSVIFYTVKAEWITIVRILNAAQDQYWVLTEDD